MSEEIKLGKIQSCEFGHGGYQDACIGVSFMLGGEGWGVGDFWGSWFIKRSDYCKWTEEERITDLGKTVMRLHQLLADAKKEKVSELKGVPIEITFENRTLKSWRVLSEVL